MKTTNKNEQIEYTKAVKRNISSQQVLKTLKLLLTDNLSMDELVERLNMNESEPIFNNSVVSKYINTCRYCGIKIHKIHNKYFIASMPFGMNLTSKELDLLIKLQEIANDTMASKTCKTFTKFIETLSKYSNKNIYRIEKNNPKLAYEVFEKAIQENRKINLMFRAKAVKECIPISITEKKGKVSYNVIFDGKTKPVSAKRITGIELLDKKFNNRDFDNQSVLFKLKGGLAQRYAARDYENIIDNHLPEYITISNFGENKNDLISRLMRYDKDCEVLLPSEFREKMKAQIHNTLSNYEE